jgi:hypothetical protein
MLRAYQRLNTRWPTAVQAITASGIAGTGDLLMQAFERRRRPATATADSSIDWARTGRFALFRLTVFGPLYSLWMNRVLNRPSISWPVKILLDQAVWTPPSLSSFYIFMAVFEGKSLRDGVDRARNLLWPTLQVNWPFWSVVQVFTFNCVPQQYRVAWVSLVQVGWNAFVSGLNEGSRRVQEGASGSHRGGTKHEPPR